MADINFDARTVDPTSTFAPLPNGEYRCHITESEIKPTANRSGKYLQLVWEVLDGEFKGRKVWDRLNIENANSTAQDIARRALSAICHATGVLQLAQSQQLHHKPVMVKLVVKQDAGYDARNEVKGYKAVEGAGIPLPASGTTAHGGDQARTIAAPAATPAANAPAWARKAS